MATEERNLSGAFWMLVEDAVLVPFGRGGDLLILLAEEALTDFSQV